MGFEATEGLGRGPGGRRWTSGELPAMWSRRVPHQRRRTGPSLAMSCGRRRPRAGRTPKTHPAREEEMRKRLLNKKMAKSFTLIWLFFHHFPRLVALLLITLNTWVLNSDKTVGHNVATKLRVSVDMREKLPPDRTLLKMWTWNKQSLATHNNSFLLHDRKSNLKTEKSVNMQSFYKLLN